MKLILILIVLIATSMSRANEQIVNETKESKLESSKSNLLNFPKVGQSTLLLSEKFGKFSDYKYEDKNTKVRQEGRVFQAEFNYGITDNWLIGASLSSGSEVEYTEYQFNTGNVDKYAVTQSGLSDLILKTRAQFDGLILGFDLGLPLEKTRTISLKEISPDERSIHFGRGTGGVSLIPMIGYRFKLGDWNFGAMGSFNYRFERHLEQKNPSTKMKITDGSIATLSPFVEWNFGEGAISMMYTIRSVSESNFSLSNGTKFKQLEYTSDYDTLDFGGNYKLNSTIALLANFAVNSHRPVSDYEIPAYMSAEASLGARFTF